VTHTRRSMRAARRRRFRRVRAVLAGGLVIGVGATATLAAWTDQEFTHATITAGTFAVESRVSAGAVFADSPWNPTLALNATGLYPGEKRAAWIQLRDKGSVGGIVNLSGVAVTGADGTSAPVGSSLALQNALKVSVAVNTALAPGTDPATWCTTSTTATSTTGTAGIATVPTPTATGTLVGTAGIQNIVTFCVILELPVGADNSVQGGAVIPTWTFTATT
jgi:predicted ribosomally synthesized peptide with SipW-like signal peptide